MKERVPMEGACKASMCVRGRAAEGSINASEYSLPEINRRRRLSKSQERHTVIGQ